MNVIIPNLDDLPAVAPAKVWRQLVNCSALTMKRAERAGTLISSGTKAHKLFTKKAILQWLGIPE